MSMEEFYRSLTNEDLQLRTEAVRNVTTWAKQIGTELTTKDLLPTLRGLLDDEDELLVVLATELGGFFDLVGGEENVAGLLELLEGLVVSEEMTVREKAIESLITIGEKLENDFEKLFIGLVIRLSEAQYFTPKSSACPLFPHAFKRASAGLKPKLVNLYVQLCQDETPMVRRAAVTNLKDLIPLMSADVIINNFVEVYKKLSSDEQDSVRLLVVELSAALAKALTSAGNTELVVELIKPVVLASAEDASWRVRFMVADSFVSLAGGMGNVTVNLVPVFVKLLKDSEQEVRTAAAGKVSGVSKLVSTDEVVSLLLPCVTDLVKDQSEHVRAALASDVMMLAPVFGKEGTSKHLLNIFLRLLEDEFPTVRLNIISKLDQVTNVIGLDKMSEHLIPAIVELAEDKGWRTRLSVIKYIPPLAKQLNATFFNEKLGDLCFGWLNDTVYAIRKAAVENLKELTIIFGEAYAKQSVFPKILELQENPNYLHRMTAIFYITSVAPLLSKKLVNSFLVTLALSLAEDPVPNIRFGACNALQSLAHKLDGSSKKKVKKMLEKMTSDQDVDVKTLATKALRLF